MAGKGVNPARRENNIQYFRIRINLHNHAKHNLAGSCARMIFNDAVTLLKHTELFPSLLHLLSFVKMLKVPMDVPAVLGPLLCF